VNKFLEKTDSSTFIINRTDAIGDLVLTLPVAKKLKDCFPNCSVVMIVSPRNKDIVEHCPYIDHYIEFTGGFFKTLKKLKDISDSQSSIFIHYGGSQVPIIQSFLVGIKYRLGLKNKVFTGLLNYGLRQSRSRSLMNETKYNLQVINCLTENEPDTQFELKDPIIKADLKPGHKESFQRLVENFKTNKADQFLSAKKKIIIHPGMTGHTLNWPVRNYARLIKKIINADPDVMIGISYTKSDLVKLEAFFSQLELDEIRLSDQIFEIEGEYWGISGYLKLLSLAGLFIGPSTGPTHLAAALGKTVLSFYSPIKTQSAVRWGPIEICADHNILVPDVICGEIRQCAGKQCLYYECMSKLEVENVFKKIKY
jgi:heptosyltransferase III